MPLTSPLAVRGAVQHLSHKGYAVATAVPGRPDYAGRKTQLAPPRTDGVTATKQFR